MQREDINIGTRRRLLIAAPGAAALVLATREQGRAKSSRAKRRKQQIRMKAEALDRMSTELAGFTEPITNLQNIGSTLQSIPGLESVGDDLMSIASSVETHRDNLMADLAIARGEPASI